MSKCHNVGNLMHWLINLYRFNNILSCALFPSKYRDNLVLALSILLLDFSLTVKAAILIFISGCGSAISSAMEGKSGFI